MYRFWKKLNKIWFKSLKNNNLFRYWKYLSYIFYILLKQNQSPSGVIKIILSVPKLKIKKNLYIIKYTPYINPHNIKIIPYKD